MGNKKGTICDAHGLYPSILKPIFRQIHLIRCAYESLRYLELKIWQCLCGRQTTDKPIALSLLRMRARRVNIARLALYIDLACMMHRACSVPWATTDVKFRS
jgi:hypothetical protein